MSERKERFTPGPWEVWDNRDKETTEHDYAVGDKDGWLVAEIGNDNIDIEEANASLIAAAPEMYALLDEIRMEVYDAIDEYGDGILVLPEETFDKIAKLLVKARGEVQE